MKRNKPKLFNRTLRKYLGGWLIILTIFSLFSVGFSSWMTTGGDTTSANITITTDDTGSSSEPICPITDVIITKGIEYNSTYGFLLDNDRFIKSSFDATSTATIKGSFKLNISNAKKVISSLVASQIVKINIALTGSFFACQSYTVSKGSSDVVTQNKTTFSHDYTSLDLSVTSYSFDFEIKVKYTTFSTDNVNANLVIGAKNAD